MTPRAKTESPTSKEIAALCARICDEKKAKDIAVLNVSKVLVITDYFVIATALNRRHMRGVAEEILVQLKKQKIFSLSVEGWDSGGWLLLDYPGVVVHLFELEQRKYYDIERLWEDAPRMNLARALAPTGSEGRRAAASDDAS